MRDDDELSLSGEHDPDALDWGVLDRYFGGTASPDDVRAIKRWAGHDLRRASELADARRVWEAAGRPTTPRFDVTAAWANTRRAMHGAVYDGKSSVSNVEHGSSDGSSDERVLRQSRRLSLVARRPKTMRLRLVAALGVGGIAALLIVAGYTRTRHWLRPPLDVAATTYTTGRGEQATISLADGTRVRLNVATTLTVPANYARGNRRLTLRGEALFAVAQRPGTPFVVVAGNSTTTVLGTTFGVRAYPGDSAVQVAVRDGRVRVNTLVLNARDVAQVAPNTAPRPVTWVSVDDALAFADGQLVLRDVPLTDAVPRLNRWFDADIRFADPTLGRKLLTASYGKGSLADLAEYLAGTFPVRVVRDGKTLTLYAR
jgi:ferric-dicitrate binding protein FerR (iron transport regulator)